MSAPALAVPFLTGFCGYSLIHERCPGQVTGRDCTCPCHTDPPAVTPPVSDAPAAPDPRGGGEQDLGDALLQLLAAVDSLNRALLDFDGSDIEVLDLLGRVRQQRMALAQLESLIETRAVKAMEQDRIEWPGGTAERRWGKDRKEWQNDELTRAVTAAIIPPLAVDPASGEVDRDLAALLHEAITAYAATNRPSWRVTAVKPLGIDPDDYCHAIPGRATVQVTLAEATP